MSGEIDGELHISAELERQPVRPVPQLERRRVVPEFQQARQRLERQRPPRFLQVSSFSPVTGEFLFIQLHPPTYHFAHFGQRIS